MPQTGSASHYTAEDEESSMLRRAMGEFREMPDLRLAPEQAARLWATDRTASERILDRLVQVGFLWKRRDGSYLRVSVA
jgi:hypothetical protein